MKVQISFKRCKVHLGCVVETLTLTRMFTEEGYGFFCQKILNIYRQICTHTHKNIYFLSFLSIQIFLIAKV